MSASLVERTATRTSASAIDEIEAWVHELTERNREIHERDAVNLDPATNTMNPRAEALLASGLGSRPSLGYPGAKYEAGLEAIEQIEIIAAELVAEVFDADHVEIRLPSGAIANLCAFMAAARPGDSVIVPPATIGGHITHNESGAAGLYGLQIHQAPVDPDRYTVDTAALATLAASVRPAVISVGGSLNLFPHPVRQIRSIADTVGAIVLFDAAHLSGLIAGRAWPNPLAEGAHMMTMSTYKSLGGPPAGVLVTNDDTIARRVEAIAYPGLTANFDVAKSAALAVTLLDWIECGTDYASTMIANARTLARRLSAMRVTVHAAAQEATRSHAFAIDARSYGGGSALARRLRDANLLTSAIGLPGDSDGGLRIGTNEITRWGAEPDDMTTLAELLCEALAGSPRVVADDVTSWRRSLPGLRFIRHAAP